MKQKDTKMNLDEFKKHILAEREEQRKETAKKIQAVANATRKEN
jgi:hypothetical protein